MSGQDATLPARSLAGSKYQWRARALRCWLCLASCMALGACANGEALPAAGAPQAGAQSSAALDNTLDAVRSAAVPAGVAQATWSQLQAELARVFEGLAATGQPVAPMKTASAAPATGGSRAALSLDLASGNGVLRWGLSLHGDCNQDGLVSLADLSPLGQRFGEASPDGAGHAFPPDSSGAVVDGNSDGLIGLPDVAPLGQNYGRRVQGYRVYRSADPADVPQVATDANGGGAQLLAELPLSGAIAEAGQRKRFEHELAEAADGWFYWVRPYDGADEGTPSNSVPATGAENLPPIAVLGADPSTGIAPLTVRLQGFSSGDLDGIIVKYEWDFDGPVNGENWVDTGSAGWIDHTYDIHGLYQAMLRVTDNAGGQDTDDVLISARELYPPVAHLTVDDPSGMTVHHVMLDATTSTDVEGPIEKFEWDWDGNGEYEFDSGATGTAECYYYDPGDFTPTVRVTDEDGLTDMAQCSVSVGLNDNWRMQHVSTTTHNHSTGEGYLMEPADIIDLNGVPAILQQYRRQYKYNGTDYGTHSYLMFSRASSPGAYGWNAPVMIEDGWRHPYGAYGGILSTVQGKPYVFYCFEYIDTDPDETRVMGSYYMSANDELGHSWPEPSTYMDVSFVPNQIHEFDGILSMSDYNSVYKATDSQGSSWSIAADAAFCMSAEHFTSVAGYPAIASGDSFGIKYARALSKDGLNWPALGSRVLLAENANITSLAEIAGLPAITGLDLTQGTVFYIRSKDSEGQQWGEPIILAKPASSALCGYISLLDGRPAVFYQLAIDIGESRWFMRCANDIEGASWGLPSMLPFDPTPATYDGPGYLLAHAPISIDQRPVLLFLLRNNSSPVPGLIATNLIEYLTYD